MNHAIIYEDEQLLIWNKPAGLATQTSNLREPDLVSLVKNYGKGAYVALINRLDQQVEGIVLFAKTPAVAKKLSKHMKEGKIHKTYLGLVVGNPKEKGTLTHYLYKERNGNHSIVVGPHHKEGKKASLSYEMCSVVEHPIPEGTTLVRIQLHTGRHHQIRVQFSAEHMPLIGDKKYGNEESLSISQGCAMKQIALSACELRLMHPVTNREIAVKIEPTWLTNWKLRR
ncbi:MAG: RluA family pseudouridine synthase [Eubacteriales bacterium]